MDGKELSNTKQITQLLIGWWLVWGFVLGIVYSIISSLLSNFVSSIVLQSIIVIILQGIGAFFIWKLSTSSTFKNKTISFTDVPKVMKNLIIFTIIVCVVNGIYNFTRVNSIINETLESDLQLKYTETMLSYIYDEDEMQEYNKQKEEAIQEVTNQLYIYLIVIEIGLTIVYLAVLPLEKKEILKYVS